MHLILIPFITINLIIATDIIDITFNQDSCSYFRRYSIHQRWLANVDRVYMRKILQTNPKTKEEEFLEIYQKIAVRYLICYFKNHIPNMKTNSTYVKFMAMYVLVFLGNTSITLMDAGLYRCIIQCIVDKLKHR